MLIYVLTPSRRKTIKEYAVQNTDMNSIERRAAISLALIYATRMLGLFMILPVFALYAEQLQQVTPLLVGVAIGIYGLTQAILQIPFGMWSDRIGRKPVIVIGLIIFAAGSIIAALSESIYGVIFGRALQGAGAIAAAIMALASDLTREEHRTKVMAVIGASIGASFMIALVIGPLFHAWVGVPGIFWITAVLAVTGIGIVVGLIPTPVQAGVPTQNSLDRASLKSVLGNTQLLRLDLGVFILHMVLTAIFVVVPVILRDHYAIAPSDHWQVYLGVLVISLILLVPSVIFSEKLNLSKPFFLSAILLCAAGQLGLSDMEQHFYLFFAAMVIYFWGFNFLEASLPSMVSKISHSQVKGTSMGVFSSSQFLGAFAGGVIAGLLVENLDQYAVFMFAFIMFLIWFLVAFSMRSPTNYRSYTVELGGARNANEAPELAKSLLAIPGVAEATVIADEGIAYLRIDRDTFEEEKLKKLCAELR